MNTKLQNLLYCLALSVLAACSKANLNQNVIDQLLQSESIIGGTENTDLDFQQLVPLVVMSDGTCSGSYIGQKTILTAAHCFNTGAIEKVYFNFKPNTISCSPVSTKIHPQYKKALRPLEYDLAVVKFDCAEADMEILNQLQPLEIADKYSQSKKALIYGYGLQSLTGQTISYPALNYLSFPKLELITDKKNSGFCLRVNPRRTPYLGDSGGPVVQFDENGKPAIIGVSAKLTTSDSHGDPRTIFQACQAKAFAHKDWILEDF